MPSTITATELAKNLSDVLNRVKYRGERFVIERNGEPIATLDPKHGVPIVTLREIAEHLRYAPRPDDQFADDLEAVIREQPKINFEDFPEWPD